MVEPTFSTINVHGSPVLVKRAGAGATMVMVHGSGGTPRFLPGMQALAEKFEVIVPLAPGFGGSAAPAWLETMSDLANFYLDFLDTLDLNNVHLVGLSLGGWVAADLAMRNAGRLASLTLVDAPGIEVAGVKPFDPVALGVEQVIRDTYFDPKLADEALARTLAPENETVRLANQRIVAKLAWQRNFHDPHLQRWLHRIRIPTLILWGENDRLFPAAYGEAWHKAIAGSQLVVIRRCGHLPIQEKPAEFAAIVGEFCAKARASA